MSENRISAYFAADELPPQAVSAPAQADPRTVPNLVRSADLYQAARARAEFDCQLGKLFNATGDVD